MFGDVNVKIEDGNLNKVNTSGIGIHVKVGITGNGSDDITTITKNMSAAKIKELLGNSPMADACIDSIENGSSVIYCVPVKVGTPGTNGAVEHVGTGAGEITVEGTPSNSCEVHIEVVETGLKNVGSIRYSIDGGKKFTEEETIPLSGEMPVSTLGIKLKFSETEFKAGDIYHFKTTAPSMNNQDVITAFDRLIQLNAAFEFVHIVGTSVKALWASLASIAEDFVSDYKKPIMIICEARAKGADEDLEEYVKAMLDERKGISSIFLQVVLSHGEYIRMDGRDQEINLAGIISGFYGTARESQSIGEVKSFCISENKLVRLLPEGIAGYLEQLDNAGYLTVRQYYGKNGYFVTNANMLSPNESDFRHAEDVRVLNRIIRDVRLAALEKLQMEIDPGDLENTLATIQEELNIPIETAVEDGIISSGRLTIDRDNVDVITEEMLDLSVTYVPMGHVRQMNISFSVENPYAEIS